MTRLNRDGLGFLLERNEALLEIVGPMLETDTAYVARLESHYQQVKGATADPADPTHMTLERLEKKREKRLKRLRRRKRRRS